MKEPVRNEIRVLYDDIYGDDPDYEFMNVKITNQSPHKPQGTKLERILNKELSS